MGKRFNVTAECVDDNGHGDAAYNLLGTFTPEELCAELLRTLQDDWGLSYTQGQTTLRLRIVAVGDRFLTTDGLALRRAGGVWVDETTFDKSEYAYYADSDGWPMEESGERLAGAYIWE